MGSISGRVTRSQGSTPIADASISIESWSDYFFTNTDSNGEFTVAVPPGAYAVWVSASGYVREIFDDIHCNDCSYPDGDIVTVEAGDQVSDIDFALDPLGSLTGWVTDAQTGEPLVEAWVQAWEAPGNFSNRSTLTNSNGEFELTDLSPGAYYVSAEASGYQTEGFDNVVCQAHFGYLDCQGAQADQVEVGVSETVSGIDLALDEQGFISGRVTDEATGQGLAFLTVFFSDVSGNSRVSTQTDAGGHFQSPGLLAGHYWVRTDDNNRYLDEMFDDAVCSRDPYGLQCPYEQATAVPVSALTETPSINFALSLGGVVSGTVTQSLDGAPIEGVELRLLDAAGSIVAYGLTDMDGTYEFGGLLSGQYRLLTRSYTHADQVYDGVACAPDNGCPTLQGTLISVQQGETVSGIDFSLDRLGSLSGRVTDSQGLPVIGAEISLFLDDMSYAQAYTHTDSMGHFEFSLLNPADYVLVAQDSNGHLLDELYPDIPCRNAQCDLSTGERIEVRGNEAVEGLEIELGAGGSISGTIVDQVSGLPLFADIGFYDTQGDFMFGAYSGEEGVYQIHGLPPGSFYAVVSGYGIADRVLGGEECMSFEPCDPLSGTPISVQLGQETSGIDAQVRPTACGFYGYDQCLRGRFRVVTKWRDSAGDEGYGRFDYLTDDSTYFWYFSSDNIEGVVKVLNACVSPFNRYWVFAAGLTDVEVTLWVTDLLTGETQTYINPQGQAFDPIQDTDAFAGCGASATAPDAPTRFERLRVERPLDSLNISQDPTPSSVAKACAPASGLLCLSNGRFTVEAYYRSPGGEEQLAGAESLTNDSGYFWFFDSNNVEILAKVLDACALTERFWVFSAGLTDVQVRLRVTDTDTGEVQEYLNSQGHAFVPIQDTQAFATCF